MASTKDVFVFVVVVVVAVVVIDISCQVAFQDIAAV